jgi:hypothetical protein
MSSILSPDPIPASSGSHQASYRPQPNRISDFVPASFGQTSALIHRQLLEIFSIRSPQDAIEQLLETPGQVLRKGGGRGQTSVIDWNGRPLFRKVYTPAGTVQALLNALRR